MSPKVELDAATFVPGAGGPVEWESTPAHAAMMWAGLIAGEREWSTSMEDQLREQLLPVVTARGIGDITRELVEGIANTIEQE